jgi:rhodanese-related sulfurtransferase
MTFRSIGPHEAKRLMDEGAILVDIREADEYAREHIPGGRHLALSQFDKTEIAAHHGRAVIFHCRSGARTRSDGTGIGSFRKAAASREPAIARRRRAEGSLGPLT